MQAKAVQTPSTDERLLALVRQGDMSITLGSASFSRRAIMQELATQYGFDYDTATADIDEKLIGDRSACPEKLVAKLARAKADAIAPALQAAGKGRTPLLITCDQVVVHKGKILEKPEDAEEARAFIRGYSHAPAATVGSVLVRNIRTGQQFGAVDTARIHFQPIPDAVVEQLIDEGLVFRCAGALMIENPLLEPLITRIEGTPDSVMGLAKHLVIAGLVEVS